MLFLIKKTIIPVLAIGSLLSFTPKAHAWWIPDLKTTGAVLAAGWLYHESTRPINLDANKAANKDAYLGAFWNARDNAASRWQSFLETARSPKGVAGIALALTTYSVVQHGPNSPILKFVKSLVNP